MDNLIQKIQQNPQLELLVIGIIGIVVLYFLLKILKLPLKIIFNGIVGVVLLYLVKMVGAYFGISIGINVVTALVAGILGVPGIIALIIFQNFM